MVKLTKSKAIDDYYSLYEYYQDTEPIINGLSVFISQSNRKVDRTQIRRNLANLHLEPYYKHLDRFTSLIDYEKDKFVLDNYTDLTPIINQLTILTERKGDVKLNRLKLLEIKMLIDNLLDR